MTQKQLIKRLEQKIDAFCYPLSGDDLADLHFLADYVWEGISEEELTENARLIAEEKLADLGGEDAVSAFML